MSCLTYFIISSNMPSFLHFDKLMWSHVMMAVMLSASSKVQSVAVLQMGFLHPSHLQQLTEQMQ